MPREDIGNKVSIDAGNKVHDAIISAFADKTGAGLFLRTIAAFFGALVSASTVLVFSAFSAVFAIASTVAALFLEGFADARQSNQSGVNTVVAAALSDLLLIDVSADGLPAGGQGGGSIDAAKAIGGKLHDLLESSFNTSGVVSDQQGADGARVFSGFTLNTAIGAALLSIITEIESLGFFKQFHELGDEVIQSLGLGRLHRRVLSPLLDTLVVKPYTRFLAAKYRPDVLTLGEAMIAANAGRLSDADLSSTLARLGYADELITELRIQHKPQVTLQEVDALIRWGDMSHEDGLNLLQSQGTPRDVAALKLRALELTHADSQVAAYAEQIFNLARDRFMPSEVFTQLLDRLPLSETDKQRRRDRVGVSLDTPHKRLSVLELIYLLERNQVTDNQVLQWALDSGFSQDDSILFQAYVDLKDIEFEAKQKAAAARTAAASARAAAKAQPKQPPAKP